VSRFRKCDACCAEIATGNLGYSLSMKTEPYNGRGAPINNADLCPECAKKIRDMLSAKRV
jgi:hypothetical protein